MHMTASNINVYVCRGRHLQDLRATADRDQDFWTRPCPESSQVRRNGRVQGLQSHCLGSPELASKVIDDLLALRLLESDKEEWIHRTIITRIWTSLDITASAVEVIEPLQSMLTTVAAAVKAPLPTKATHAAQTVRCSI